MDHMHGDFYSLFSAYWWLLFPLAWAIGRLVRLILEHKRSGQALEVVQTFAQQGKEIPPDLLKVLQQPAPSNWPFDRTPQERRRGRSRGLIFVGFIFLALALSFPVLIYGKAGGDDRDNIYGMWFVTVLMAGFAAAFFTSAWLMAKDEQRLDPP